MATIPDVRSIPRSVTSGEQSISTVRNAGAIGQGMQAIGQGIGQIVDADTRYQTARASNALLISKTELDNDEFEGVEYGEITKQYQDRYKASREDISSKITNPLARRAFNEKADLLEADGMARASNMARKRELDVERANIQGDLLKLREAGLNGDLIGTLDAAKETLDIATEKGYYTEQEALKVYESWKNDAAVGKLEMMEPEDRLTALKQPWANNLPSDVKAKIERTGKAEKIKQDATLLAESSIARGMSRLEYQEQVNTITDIKQREEARSVGNTMYDRQERNLNEAQGQAYEDIAARIDIDGEDYDDIVKADEASIRALTPAQRSNLRKISEERFNPRTNSDPDMLIELSAAATTNDWAEYNRLIKDESSRLSPSDRVKFTVKGFESQIPAEAQSKLTNIQAITSALSFMDITGKKATPIKNRLIREVDQWRIREIERTGKEPTNNDRDKYIDTLMLSRDRGFFDTEKPMFEREPIEQVAIIQEQEPDMFETIKAHFAKRGIDPTDQQIIDAYSRVRGQ